MHRRRTRGIPPRFATCPARVAPDASTARPGIVAARPPRAAPVAIVPRRTPAPRKEPLRACRDRRPRPHLETHRRASSGARSRRTRTRSGSPRCGSVAIDGDQVVVEAPRELRAWVADRFARVLQASAAAVLGPRAVVRVRAGDEGRARAGAARPRRRGRRRHTAPDAVAATTRDRPQPEVHLRAVRHRRRQPLRPRRRARRRRAARPGLQPALHLRPARRRQDPPAALDRQLRPRLRRRADASATRRSRRFTNEFVAALHRRLRSTASRAASARNDVLLIDDVQFLASQGRRPRRSSSTPSTRSTRPAASSSSPPTASRATSRRSRTACASASSPASSPTSPPPDLATRLTVLRKRVQHDGIELDDEAVARRSSPSASPTNVRALEGALIRVVAYALAHRPRRSTRRSPTRSSATSTRRQPGRGAGRAAGRRRPHPVRRSSPTPSASPRDELLSHEPPPGARLAAPGRHVPRARAHGRDPARDRPRASAAATTRPSCTPAGAPPSASPRDPEAFETVRTLDRRRLRRPGADRRD